MEMKEEAKNEVKDKAAAAKTLKKELNRLTRLREDVLLLRFHLARRTDITKLIDETDRLASEAALKASLEILEMIDRQEVPPIGHVAAATSSLMYAVDVLVNAARMAEEAGADVITRETFGSAPDNHQITFLHI